MANSDHQRQKKDRKQLPPAKPWRESSDLYGWRFHDLQGARLIILDATNIAHHDPKRVPRMVIEYP